MRRIIFSFCTLAALAASFIVSPALADRGPNVLISTPEAVPKAVAVVEPMLSAVTVKSEDVERMRGFELTGYVSINRDHMTETIKPRAPAPHRTFAVPWNGVI